jgi:hypothetical protein
MSGDGGKRWEFGFILDSRSAARRMWLGGATDPRPEKGRWNMRFTFPARWIAKNIGKSGTFLGFRVCSIITGDCY